MGRVIERQPPDGGRAAAGARPTAVRSSASSLRPSQTVARSHRARRRASATALVLGAGGFTGGAYEIGALRALQLLAVDWTVNDLDIYVGTSAGALIAAAVANGITPEEMMRVVVGEGRMPFPPAELGTLLRPDYAQLLGRGLRLPLALSAAMRELVRDVRQVSALDVVLMLAGALPAGLYSAEGIERYVRRILTDHGRTDGFADLGRRLYLAATDLDSGARVVFGSPGWDSVPISRAVSASCALPMVYRPVRIGGRDYVDGGIVSTVNLDIAIEAGARLLLVVNPLVAFDGGRFGGSWLPARRVSEMGLPHVGYQAFKLLAQRALREQAEAWRTRHPDVDIVLIEPDGDDELMFATNVMNFSSRAEIARHGFRSVVLRLAADYPMLRQTFTRHGIEVSSGRLREAIDRLSEQDRGADPWRRRLQATAVALRSRVAHR
ncbi:MAG TPA: patatin-like phospholipase family protein [Solirubrobacteraceae bacterium]|nr:patatin-like phospholipase family protein [Solirubrobacteraceae bacterium]